MKAALHAFCRNLLQAEKKWLVRCLEKLGCEVVMATTSTDP